jgi:hypothetical protein
VKVVNYKSTPHIFQLCEIIETSGEGRLNREAELLWLERCKIIDLKNVERKMCNAGNRNELNFNCIGWLNNAVIKADLIINNKITPAFHRSSTDERYK